MSELDAKVKEELVKQIQEIATGKGEMGVEAKAASKPNENIESDNIEKHESVSADAPQVQTVQVPVNQFVPAKISQTEASMPMKPQTNKDQKIDPMIVFGVVVVLFLGGLFLFNKFGVTNKAQAQQYPQQQYPQQQYPQQQYPQQKNQNFNPSPYQNHPQEFDLHLDQRQQQFRNELSMNDVKSYVDRRLGVVEQRLDRLDHRTWLLAVANNENSTISRKLAERVNSHDLSRKYISFDSNWNLNKMPEFIRLSNEQRYNLLNEVDDRNYQKQYRYEYDNNTRTYRSIPQIVYPQSKTYVYPQTTTYVYPQAKTYVYPQRCWRVR